MDPIICCTGIDNRFTGDKTHSVRYNGWHDSFLLHRPMFAIVGRRLQQGFLVVLVVAVSDVNGTVGDVNGTVDTS